MVREKGRQQESLQGTNILRYLEHHPVFICSTSLSATPEHPITPNIAAVGIRVRSQKQLVGHQGARPWGRAGRRMGRKGFWVS